MNTNLPSHLSIQEINHYNLDIQYKNWISQLKVLDEEFSFYSKLISSEKLKDVSKEEAEIASSIPTLKQENQSMLDKVINYRNQLESLRECEDVACDTFYLNDHQRFRAEIEEHIENVHNFKRSIFKTLTDF